MLKVAVTDASLSTVTSLTVIPPAVTLTVVEVETKFVPVNVTGIVVPLSPLEGEIEASVGVTTPTVNCTGSLVPREFVTVT